MDHCLRLAYLLSFSPLVAEEVPVLMDPIAVSTIPCYGSGYSEEYAPCSSLVIDDVGRIVVEGAVDASAVPAAILLTRNGLNVTLDADLVSLLDDAHGLLFAENIAEATVTVNGSITTESDAVSAIMIGGGGSRKCDCGFWQHYLAN